MSMPSYLSRKFRHFFHVVSNVRPLYWIITYVCLIPIFALLYWWLPDTQFRIPDGAATDYGSWLYYSIVTITTLGFGDYTPAHGWAQAVTALEVVCGLSIFGFFLNSVGSMKSEIDVESEIEKQRMVHEAGEKEKLMKSIPAVMHNLNIFLAYCYAISTPEAKRSGDTADFNPDLRFSDMYELYKPSGLPIDHSRMPVATRLLKCAARTSLCLDSLQSRVDLSLWPDILSDCFDFVANYQMLSLSDTAIARIRNSVPEEKGMTIEEVERNIARLIGSYHSVADAQQQKELAPAIELYHFVKDNGMLARKIEVALTRISTECAS